MSYIFNVVFTEFIEVFKLGLSRTTTFFVGELDELIHQYTPSNNVYNDRCIVDRQFGCLEKRHFANFLTTRGLLNNGKDTIETNSHYNPDILKYRFNTSSVNGTIMWGDMFSECFFKRASAPMF